MLQLLADASSPALSDYIQSIVGTSIIVVVGMFLRYLNSQERAAASERDKDREARHKMANDCHGMTTNLFSKVAEMHVENVKVQSRTTGVLDRLEKKLD